MLRYACLALILLWCNTSAFAQQGRRMQGYLKQDVKVFEGTQTLRRGEKIACNVMPDGKRCCFEEEAGTACVDVSNISDQKVAKRDIAIAAVSVNQSLDARKNACEEGITWQKMSDHFAWSYGVRLRPDEGRALIRVSHVARKGQLTYQLQSLTKVWTGSIDGSCHVFNFTKSDIAAFLKEYEKIAQFLDPAIDLNLKVEVWVEVFSEFDEESYRNNLVKIQTQLPVNSEDDWPSASSK